MAPKKFNRHFEKLPKELQLRIWVLSMEPRIIRAKWETVIIDDNYKAIYRLSCGPVPKILHICRESRAEALKHYTPIKSRGAHLEQAEKRCIKDNENSIYMNFDIDTLYFVDFPDTNSFLSWIRRVPREPKPKNNAKLLAEGDENGKVQKPQKVVKHIAFHRHLPMRWSTLQSKVDVWYGMAIKNPGLETIKIVMDGSSFEKTEKPHTFSFKKAPTMVWRKQTRKPLSVGGQPAGSQAPAARPSTARTDSSKTASKEVGVKKPAALRNGNWVPVPYRAKVDALLDGFWEKSETHGTALGKTFREWRMTEEGKLWVAPRFEVMSISINPKKNVRGG
ncbi:uncharacterized protein LY89DRAFT_114820 [Mollisia scopiformis]|uniref:2EXR domain-containing protein n=1 Tax=Mollisia scopiformis TaxID=149040 RepID=A0A194X5P2_MOLSC|nr:uncharacterized protein LY89DRAFT_114820 [Mollisia scopiformis]KUJ15505.1 hypothetical protein LY89DRAFT_114820 [Mollisia scopiformis]